MLNLLFMINFRKNSHVLFSHVSWVGSWDHCHFLYMFQNYFIGCIWQHRGNIGSPPPNFFSGPLKIHKDLITCLLVVTTFYIYFWQVDFFEKNWQDLHISYYASQGSRYFLYSLVYTKNVETLTGRMVLMYLYELSYKHTFIVWVFTLSMGLVKD